MIKFRAWDTTNKEFVNDVMIDLSGKVYYNDKINIYSQWREVVNIITLRYTGLNDKNGKEIYVGDIIKLKIDDKNLYIVEFSLGSFVLCSDFGEDYIIGNIKTNYIEIVGNVHQNPELLEKVKKI